METGGTQNYRIVALTVSTALFMQFLSGTALNTALPVIAREFGIGAVDLNVAILSYQLAVVALIPVGSGLAERIGARNGFIVSLGLFILGSILCALSSTLPELVAARAVQGGGGALIAPISRLLVVRSAERHELMNALNWLVVPAILGPTMGPVVGGVIVTYASWKWIFLMNVPLALIGIALTWALIPDVRVEVSGRFDSTGLALVATSALALVMGLGALVDAGTALRGFAMLVAAAILMGLYTRRARRVANPVVDLSLSAIPSFKQSLLAGSYLRVISIATGFLLPLWFQLAMHLSATKSGVLVMMTGLGALFSRAFGSSLPHLFRPRRLAIGSTLALCVALLLTACIRADWPFLAICAVLALQGVLVAVPLLVINAAVFVDIPAERTPQAAGYATLVQQLTMTLGVTAGVMSLGAMRWFAGFTDKTDAAYTGSFLFLAALAAGCAISTARISSHSIGMLIKDGERA